MEDALHVVNTSITNYLSTNRDLGDVPSSCSVLVQKEKANFWEDKSLEWWQPGIDLYEYVFNVSCASCVRCCFSKSNDTVNLKVYIKTLNL